MNASLADTPRHRLSRLKSAGIAAALLTLSLTPALAQSAQMRAEAMKLAGLCRADFDKLCSGVRPGGGRVVQCLQTHLPDLSPGCAKAMPEVAALKDQAAASGQLPK